MAHAQLDQLITKLTASTSIGTIGWAETAEEGTYQTSFANSSVQISARYGVDDEGDPLTEYMVSIFNKSGKLVDEVSSFTAPSAQVRHDMEKMYEDARRIAMHADLTVSNILSELNRIEDLDEFMKDRGYVLIARRDMYFSREKMKCFSREYVEDAPDAETMAQEADSAYSGPEIAFYTNEPLPAERKKEITDELLGED